MPVGGPDWRCPTAPCKGVLACHARRQQLASRIMTPPAPASPPLFDWLTTRAAGVLLHPTSLPGDFGVGTLDGNLDRFLEFLEAAGCKYWQLCPLGPTGYGDSPYQLS